MKLQKYSPTQFNINFAPSPTMPTKVREKILNQLEKEFSAYTIDKHLIPAANSLSQEQEMAPNTTIPNKLDLLNQRYKSIVKTLETPPAPSKDGKNEESETTVEPVKNNSAYIEKMNSIQSELTMLEWQIYGQKAVADVETTKKNLQVRIADLTLQQEQLTQEVAFRMGLAKIPTGMKETSPGNAESPLPDKLMSIMLTYNTQYYALMQEAKLKYGEQMIAQKELGILQNRLKMLNTPISEPVDKTELLKVVDEKIKGVESQINKLSAAIVENEKANAVNFYPPIKSYYLSHHNYSISNKNVALVGIAAMLFAAVTHVAYSLFTTNFDGRNMAKEQASFRIGQKMSGRN
jgi:hypothetical protein